MPAVCYKTVIVGPSELMEPGFKENYDANKTIKRKPEGKDRKFGDYLSSCSEAEDSDENMQPNEEIYWNECIKIKDEQTMPYSAAIT